MLIFSKILLEKNVLGVNYCNKYIIQIISYFIITSWEVCQRAYLLEGFSLPASENTEALEYANTPKAIVINSFDRHL